MLRNTSLLLSKRSRTALFALMGLGGAGIVVGLLLGGHSLWPAYLNSVLFYLTIALGAAVFVGIHHATNASWSTTIRRIPEAMIVYLPVGALTMIGLIFGGSSIYEWMHGASSHEASSAAFRSSYLSSINFYLRTFVILGIWIAMAMMLRRESIRQDADGLIIHSTRSKRLSSAFLAVFVLTLTIASVDWMMSIEPEFYSTIYAWYVFSGLFVSGIAAVTVAVVLLRRSGRLPLVFPYQLHNLGKLMFGFATFWAYMWLCQYLLVYYTNLPEEAAYYIQRIESPGWNALFWINLVLNWLLPFVLLIKRGSKLRERTMLIASASVLVGHWLDLYIMIQPSFGGSPMPGLVDLLLTVGVGALFLYITIRALGRNELVPIRDPYLEENIWNGGHTGE